MNILRKLFGAGTDNRLRADDQKTPPVTASGFYSRKEKRAPYTEETWSSTKSENYRFPIGEFPKDPLEQCFAVLDKADKELCKELEDEISGLLIVASLFLSVVTAFSITSFGWLQPDDKYVSITLLGDIVKLLNDTEARGTVPPRDATSLNLDFRPRDSEILINQMWFLSMILSLGAVVVGTLCLQWLSIFRRRSIKEMSCNEALARRQLRFEGLMGWGVPYIPSFLLLAVQGTFVLFAAGLIILLWSVNRRVAIPLVVIGVATALFLVITAVLPLLQSVAGWIIPPTLKIPQCPYKSPMSWVIHRGCVLLSIIVTLPLTWFKKVSEWHNDQTKLLTDYTWQVFDDLWRKQREASRRRTETAMTKPSHYLAKGLESAIDKLLFQSENFHIAYAYLQDEVEAHFREHIDPACHDVDKRKIIRDAIIAHQLDHFALLNPRLDRAILPHRAELQVRIKNSSQELGGSDIIEFVDTPFGCKKILEFPIRNAQDAKSLPSELRYQLLKFAEWYLDSDRCTTEDAKRIKFVWEASQTPCDDQEEDAYEPPLMDRMKNVLKLLDDHFTEQSHRGRQSSNAATSESTLGGENGASPDRKVDQGHNDSAGSDTPAGKVSSAMMEELCGIVRDKLEEYRKRKQAGNTNETPSENRSNNVTTGEAPPDSQADQGRSDSAGSDAPADKDSSAISSGAAGGGLGYEMPSMPKEGDKKLSDQSSV